jgi:hypothetical protein
VLVLAMAEKVVNTALPPRAPEATVEPNARPYTSSSCQCPIPQIDALRSLAAPL